VTEYLIFIPVGYLIGALPFGVIATWLVKRVDVRDYGSGATGMTNVIRTAGVKAGAAVLLLDMGKAVLAVALAIIFTDSPGVEAATGIAALVGHIWPIYTKLRGGKGTSVGWAALCIICPWCGLAATVIGLTAVFVSRYVSLGSLLGASSGAVMLIAMSALGIEPFGHIWYGIVGLALVLFRHKDNAQRLARGEERRLGTPAELIRRKTGGQSA
jgi:glycerol-3-phosphate acyltransferase PlsY